MGNFSISVFASSKKYNSISRAIRFAPLVVCKIKGLYIGISIDIIAIITQLLVCKLPPLRLAYKNQQNFFTRKYHNYKLVIFLNVYHPRANEI